MRFLLRHSLFIVAGYAAYLASDRPSAHACSIAAPLEHLTDPAEEAADTTPPGAPVLGAIEFSRHPGLPRCNNPSSCAGSGILGLTIEAPADDRTPAAEMGYVIEVAGGTAPANINLPDTPLRAGGGMIWFYFSDDDQSIDVTLSVRAMDLGGNVGAPTLIRVTHPGNVGCVGDDPGDEVGGCSAGARAGLGTAAMVFLAMALVFSRRRAPRA